MSSIMITELTKAYYELNASGILKRMEEEFTVHTE